MSRLLLALAFASSAAVAHAADRYGPTAPALRGAERLPSANARLLTWAGKDAGLRGRPAPAPAAPAAESLAVRAVRQLAPAPLPAGPPPPPVQQAALTPPPEPVPTAPVGGDYASRLAEAKRQAAAARPTAMRYGATAGRSSAPPGTYAPQTPRRYSVGREFGVAPDPIRMPDPSVLAFSPEVGAAFAASNERAAEETTLSPADRDQLEQANQDDARRETRQRARDRANAAKK